VERADEVRQIRVAGLQRDVRDRHRPVAEQRDRPPEPDTDQVLVRRDPDLLAKDPQEVERAQLIAASTRLEI
jgi:hypothetical protein